MFPDHNGQLVKDLLEGTGLSLGTGTDKFAGGTAVEPDGPLHRLDDLQQGNFLRRLSQLIAALGSLVGADNTGGYQLTQNLQGKTQRHARLFRDGFRIGLLAQDSQNIDNPHRVVRFQSQLHFRLIPPRLSLIQRRSAAGNLSFARCRCSLLHFYSLLYYNFVN